MFLDYDFRHFNFRLVLYMIALNAIGILVIRSATNLDEGAVAAFDRAFPPKPVLRDTPAQLRFREVMAMQRKADGV